MLNTIKNGCFGCIQFMFEKDFDLLREFLCDAGPEDATLLVQSAWTFQMELRGKIHFDIYSEEAMLGMLESIFRLANLLRGEKEYLRFTLAKCRYRSREAVFAFQDELMRQLREQSQCH